MFYSRSGCSCLSERAPGTALEICCVSAQLFYFPFLFPFLFFLSFPIFPFPGSQGALRDEIPTRGMDFFLNSNFLPIFHDDFKAK